MTDAAKVAAKLERRWRISRLAILVIPSFGAGVGFMGALLAASQGRPWVTLIEAILTGAQLVLLGLAVRRELERTKP